MILMRVLFLGDTVGQSGREAVISFINGFKAEKHVDCIIVNAENIAHGFGIRANISNKLLESGVDVITMGNHTFDQKDDIQLFDQEKRLVRPANYPKGTPGHGFYIHETADGKKIMVVNLIGRVFMEQNDDPFQCMDMLLKTYKLGTTVDAIFVDFHAEATAEKVAFARFFDGRVTAIVGTHTHVPTADAQILNNGTGYLSDAGMCGDYNSVIGMEEENSILRFTSKVHMYARLTPASGSATVCGVVVDIGESGKCTNISTIRSGGFLREQKSC